MKTVIIGRGRVGTHLQKALGASGECLLIDSRTLQGMPTDADAYIIAVTEQAIADVAGRVRDAVPEGVIAHTAGAVCVEGVDVFYPMQTFSPGRDLNYREIPVFVEAHSDAALRTLTRLAHEMSDVVVESTPEIRETVHLAAVFACNFANRMLTGAADVMASRGLPLSLLKALVGETVDKAFANGPRASQTGPAVRHQHDVIASERRLLGRLAPQHVRTFDVVNDDIEQDYK